ncbi:DNA polymerase III subunit alpha [Niallia sp. NCCP-28]|uniref:DNA polymerase III subunit alpha n=1 Tax=Niallia sp. NCCP-28 TaxID=2934712 RepID=UPI00207ED291|nr:DNA polymerase III subunit alpha [Niallia sp. NCCP-28]GKU81554.1 DNA polymerase III subunit alpha [Niallia sp. NCCP-28]
MAFVHLQVSSAFSLLSSPASIKELVAEAKKRGYQSLALTDRNVMYGAASFYKECQKQGIKPILGLTVDIISEQNSEKSYPLVLLAKNKIGFLQLLKISSTVQTKNPKGMPVKWLRHYTDGLFAITPGHEGEVEQALVANEYEHAVKTVRLFKHIFAEDHFFLSMQKHGLEIEKDLNEQIKKLAEQENLKMVATNNVQYIHKEDSFARSCLLAIKTGMKLADMEQDEWNSEEFYLKEETAMMEIFADEPEAIENTGKVAESCLLEMEQDVTGLPKYDVPDGISAKLFLEKLCKQGLVERYGTPDEQAVKRLDYELNIINKMNYSDYFLIVWDFMKFARDHNILTGPGRGSAAGSIVAYCLYITDVDPIKFHLLFERFLNPQRITMPDIDIDFPDTKREMVIDYVKNKYGELHVAQIITFGTLAAKASLRDVGRVFGLSMKELEALSRSIPSKLGITLKQSLKESKELQNFVFESDRNKKIFDTACKLEGLPRHTSTHAAGVVLSEQPLVNVIPIQSGNENIYLTQYSMEYLEELGLLKMDFLGLRNLTLIESILDLIYRATRKKIAIKDIPLDDDAVFQLLSSGETTGIFQLESDGMRNVLKQLQPTEFEDIVAVNALYRPGPMENIPLYIRRKHGKEQVDYYHHDLQDILENTYGVIVYQEQIIQIAAKMAGFSLGEADILRRAVSKKQKTVLDQQREYFIKGAKEKGYQEETANNIYELIVRFADYGFNRSHAVAYSMIAYQLAYLKAKFPLFFMASLLTTAIGNEKKILQYIQELKQMNIRIVPPSINKSGYSFYVEGESILFSLSAIKGIGNTVLKEIVRVRKQKKFEDLFDFCLRVSTKIVNKKAIEALIYSGSMDEFGEDRATLFATIDVAIQHAQLVHPDELDQEDLFGEDDFLFKPKYADAEKMSTEEKLLHEKESLGLYLSDHPVSVYQDYFLPLNTCLLTNMAAGVKQRGAVYLSDINGIRTKKGEAMAFLVISDQSGEMNAVVFPLVYKRIQPFLKKGEILVMDGKVEERNGNKQFNVQNVAPIKEAVQSLSINMHKLYIKIIKDKDHLAVKKELLQIIKQYPGSTPVIIHYAELDKTIPLQKEWNISANSACLEKIQMLLGDSNVILSD